MASISLQQLRIVEDQLRQIQEAVHNLPICFPRPATTLSADEQSYTHERIADMPVSVRSIGYNILTS